MQAQNKNNSEISEKYAGLFSQLKNIFALAPGKHEVRIIGRWYEIEFQGKKIRKTIKDASGEKDKAFAIGLGQSPDEVIQHIQKHFGQEPPHNCYIVTNSVADSFQIEMKPLKVSDALKKFAPISHVCTKASDIMAINSIIIDIDRIETPKNADGQKLCANPQELEQLNAGREAVIEYLKEFGITPAYQLCSGNGYQIGIFFEPQTQISATRKIIKPLLQGLSKKFESTGINIDVALEDPSRVTRLVSTWNVKPDRAEVPEQDRKYRLATLLECANNPQQNTWDSILALAKSVESLAKEYGKKKVAPKPVTPVAPNTVQHSPALPVSHQHDPEQYLRKFIQENGIEVSKEKTDDNCQIRFCLDHCLFNPDHSGNEASLFVGTTGGIGYQCFHPSCKYGNTGEAWKEVKALYPTWKNTRACQDCGKEIYFEQTDKGWKPFSADTNKLHRCRKNATAKPSARKTTASTTAADNNDADNSTRETADEKSWISHRGGVITGIAAECLLADRKNPLIYSQASFWEYDCGIWKEVEGEQIEKEIADMLGAGKSTKKTVQDVYYNMSLQAKKVVKWNPFPMKLCFLNGVLDVETKEFEAHNKEYYQTNQLDYNYDNKKNWLQNEILKIELEENAPNWTRFISSLGFEESTLMRLQEWFGYCLIPLVPIERSLFLKGEGGNGKGTIIDTLQAMLGESQCSALEPDEIFEPYMASVLRNKRVNLASDIDTTVIFSTKFKKMVSGEKTLARNIYGKPFFFNPFAKFIFAANDFIPTRDRSKGFYRRFDTLEFKKQFEGKNEDKNLKKAVIKEAPYVFYWALVGLYRLLQNAWNFTDSAEFATTKQKFEYESNPLRVFLDENYTITPADSPERSALNGARNDYLSTKDFRKDYVAWCFENGHKPLHDTNLGKEMIRLGIEKIRVRTNGILPYYYFGITKK